MDFKALFLGISFLPLSVVNAADIVSLDCTHEDKKSRSILVHLDIDMNHETADVIRGVNSSVQPVTITPTTIIVGKDNNRGQSVFTISRESLSFTVEFNSQYASGKYQGTC